MFNRNRHEALFLHGGPGFNAEVERVWFGDTVPIHWWSQPIVAADDATPFDTLVKAAEIELTKLTEASSSMADVIAHSSFGAQLGLHLAQRQFARIRSLTLLGSTADPLIPFLRLGRALLRLHPSSELEQAVMAAQEGIDDRRFVDLINAILTVPNFMDHYWALQSSAQRDRHRALAAKAPPLEFGTFMAVMRNIVALRPRADVSAFKGKVAILLGRHDPFLEPAEDDREWRRFFPAADIRELACGHQVQFETPAEVWLPA